MGRKQPFTTGNQHPGAPNGSSSRFILNQSPQPSRLDKLQHVGQLARINVAPSVRRKREFGKHPGSAIRIDYKSGLIIEFGQPGRWQAQHLTVHS
ncbi:hypothetical protein [Pseudomonas sp. SMV7]|uniref:hypothetical protein n=1 Tax=Pseudomonas sp. SMV7 TaxID=3390194 RepID=UPI003F82EAB6